MASLVKDEPSGLNALTASEAASRIAAGEITSERLVGDCLDRIGAHDDTLHAWTYVDADHALAQARASRSGLSQSSFALGHRGTGRWQRQ